MFMCYYFGGHYILQIILYRLMYENEKGRAKLHSLRVIIMRNMNMKRKIVKNMNYSNPPVTEVYCSIAFDPPKNFKSIYVKDVWELFKNDFPKNVEMPWLEPQFEIFGGMGKNFQLGNSFPSPNMSGTRQWFMEKNENYLIQFQRNVITLNWRKKGEVEGVYSSFNDILEKFEDAVGRLDKYFQNTLEHRIVPRQCEVFYLNILDGEGEAKCSDFLKYLTIECENLEDMNFSSRKLLTDNDANPIGRLMCNINLQDQDNQEKRYILNFLVRGRPPEVSLESAFDFLAKGHDIILESFNDMITSTACELWGGAER